MWRSRASGSHSTLPLDESAMTGMTESRSAPRVAFGVLVEGGLIAPGTQSARRQAPVEGKRPRRRLDRQRRPFGLDPQGRRGAAGRALVQRLDLLARRASRRSPAARRLAAAASRQSRLALAQAGLADEGGGVTWKLPPAAVRLLTSLALLAAPAASAERPQGRVGRASGARRTTACRAPAHRRCFSRAQAAAARRRRRLCGRHRARRRPRVRAGSS